MMLLRTTVCLLLAVVLNTSTALTQPSRTSVRDEAYQEQPSLGALVDQVANFRSQLEQRLSNTSIYSKGAGAGIVMTGGGPDIFARALVLVKFLRRELDCQLPVEVGYIDDGKISTAFEKELRALSRMEGKAFMADLLSVALGQPSNLVEKGVRIVNLGQEMPELAVALDHDRLASFSRVMSIHKSSFNKVIYMDVDSIPLYNPSLILEWDSMKASGAVLWPNFDSGRTEATPRGNLWEALHLQAPWKGDSGWRCLDPGQLIIDRTRHADVLEWVMFLSLFNNIFYKDVANDKHVWELAIALAGKQHTLKKLPYHPRAAMGSKVQEVYELLSIVQNSPSGMPVFARAAGHGLLNISGSSPLDLQWLTIGLPDSGWHAYTAHKDSNTFGIHDQSTIYPEDANCDSVDVDTARLFAESDAIRWQGCFARTAELQRKLPVALLPLSWYPSQVTKKIQLMGRAMIMLQTFMRATRKPTDGSVIHAKEIASLKDQPSQAERSQANKTAEAANATSLIQESPGSTASSSSAEPKSKMMDQIHSLASDASVGGSLRADKALIAQSKQEFGNDIDRGTSRALSEGHVRSKRRGRHARLQLRQRRTQTHRGEAQTFQALNVNNDSGMKQLP